jgi:addiction module antitoxin, relB/dinJ family
MYSQEQLKTQQEARMASIPTTTMRIDPQLKEESSKVLEDLGLTLSGAVTIFLKAVVREQGLPFEVKLSQDIHNEA